MRTLNISISEQEYKKLGIKQDQLNFAEFLELISKELMHQNLNKSLELAHKYGMSTMTMDEISNEVKSVRKDAKNHH